MSLGIILLYKLCGATRTSHCTCRFSQPTGVIDVSFAVNYVLYRITTTAAAVSEQFRIRDTMNNDQQSIS